MKPGYSTILAATQKYYAELNAPNISRVRSKVLFTRVFETLEAADYIARVVTKNTEFGTFVSRFTLTLRGKGAANGMIRLPLAAAIADVFQPAAPAASLAHAAPVVAAPMLGVESPVGGGADAGGAPAIESSPNAAAHANLPIALALAGAPHDALLPAACGDEEWRLQVESSWNVVSALVKDNYLQTPWIFESNMKKRVQTVTRTWKCTMCPAFQRGGTSLSCTARLQAITDLTSAASDTKLYSQGGHRAVIATDDLVWAAGSKGLPPPLIPLIDKLLSGKNPGPKGVFTSLKLQLQRSQLPQDKALCVYPFPTPRPSPFSTN